MIQHDIQFMDEWDPPEWLLEDPSEKDAFDFVQMMADRERDLVRAWRKILDKDGSNRVSWFEFKEAAKRLNFRGNTAAAWRYLDHDLSGYITLREIEPQAHFDLMEFKAFAENEFGSVNRRKLITGGMCAEGIVGLVWYDILSHPRTDCEIRTPDIYILLQHLGHEKV